MKSIECNTSETKEYENELSMRLVGIQLIIESTMFDKANTNRGIRFYRMTFNSVEGNVTHSRRMTFNSFEGNVTHSRILYSNKTIHSMS